MIGPVRRSCSWLAAAAGRFDARGGIRICMRLAAILTAWTTSALLVAGCGSSASSSRAPTRAGYTVRANAICAAAGHKSALLIKQLTAAAESVGSSGGVRAGLELASELQQLDTTASSTLSKLRALEQPTADRAEIERFLTPFASVTAALNRAVTAVDSVQPQKALSDLERVAADARQMTNATKALGLTACQKALGGVP